jgi:2-polyprenyl-6-methoxyphenol hydroxylase-like FAD-dependent oxidoreductase
MMLGYLLARAGVHTVVLEKHADFFRDFRGDTVHPSTLRIMDELGLLDALLERPHQRLRMLTGWFGTERIQLGDFRGLPERYAFVAMMPQWDFLDFLADHARTLPAFTLRREANATGLIVGDDGRVTGVRGAGPDGEFDIQADCTIGCDGRHSTVRAAAGLTIEDIGAPIDVLWFRVGRDPTGEDSSLARIAPGRIVVTIDRGDYWQCAFVLPKGGAAAIRREPIDVFRAQVLEAAPLLAPHMYDVRSWDDVKLLTVAVDRLTRWSKPGVLCIGDAAHAMSPVGGVGINLAIQDAVAAANVLWKKDFSLEILKTVQRRREFPTRVTQLFQVVVQNFILRRVLEDQAALAPPLPVRLLSRFAFLRRIPARMVGLGARPEHIGSPAVAA